MQKAIKYMIFKTKWGYFGLAGTEFAICRTHLPCPNPEKIKSLLLKNLKNPQYDKNLFKATREQITAYFEGALVNFNPDTVIALDGCSKFAILVLTGCRDIKFGQTVSYGQLAKKLGRPAATRAIGSALAKNPLPLIVPCHRVIRSDGRIGGFSAHGGTVLKNRLLKHEQQAIINPKND